MSVDVSVIVCAYTEDRWDDLVAVVKSIEQQLTPPREIIIVIDHNEQLFYRAYAHLENVIVMENRDSRGLSGGRNSGVTLAKGAIIAFIDDDAVAAPDWLEKLCTGYAETRVIGVGGGIEPLWPDARPTWFPDEFDWVVGCDYRGMPKEPSQVRNLIGANMSFKREVFEKVGRFRLGKVGMRSRPEETELCIRARQQWPESIWMYEPRAKVSHKVPTSRTTFKYFLTRCFDEGLGKAAMVYFVGSRDGLYSERAYVLKTLPIGIWRGITDVFARGDVSGIARAITILAGLGFTMAGYLIGIILLYLKDLRLTDNQMNPI